jgi:outer membrane protein OmpA-like peptidoglycan-associated protein
MKIRQLFLFLFLSQALLGQTNISQLKKAKNLGSHINTDLIEGEPKISPDGSTLYFTRRNDKRNVGGKNDDGDIWFSVLNVDSSWSEAKNLGKPVNSYAFNQVIAIHANGKIMLISGDYQADKHSDIYITALSKLGWTTPKIIAFDNLDFQNNDATYSATPDLKTIVLSMKNFENSLGKNDLYVSFLQANGNWSKPVNLGDSINSSDDELYPVIAHDQQTLYFSSKGHGGYGDFYIFASKRLDQSWTKWSKPQNLGKNINTNGYDADFTFDAQNHSAYISSDMEAVDDFDIYSLEMPPLSKPTPVAIIKIKLNNLNKDSSVFYSIRCSEIGSKQIVASEDSIKSYTNLILNVGKKYKIEISSNEYKTYIDTINLAKDKEFSKIEKSFHLFPQSIDLNLNKIESDEIIPNMTSPEILNLDSLIQLVNFRIMSAFSLHQIIPNKAMETNQSFTVVINNLNFETGKAHLSRTETEMLKELALELKKDLMLEIIGHTDNTGNAAANLQLSKERASEVADYLVELGIEKSRISFKGMGETLPVAPNDTEEHRKYNRRVEFRIYFK